MVGRNQSANRRGRAVVLEDQLLPAGRPGHSSGIDTTGQARLGRRAPTGFLTKKHLHGGLLYIKMRLVLTFYFYFLNLQAIFISLLERKCILCVMCVSRPRAP